MITLKLPFKIPISSGVIICFILLMSFYLLVFMPRLESIEPLRRKLDQIEMELSKYAAVLKERKYLAAKAPLSKRQLQEIEKFVMKTEDTTILVKSFSKIAKDAGLKAKDISFSFGKIAAVDKEALADGFKRRGFQIEGLTHQDIKDGFDGIERIPVCIYVSGKYNQIMKFLCLLSTHRYLSAIENVIIARGKVPPYVHAQISVDVFLIKEDVLKNIRVKIP